MQIVGLTGGIASGKSTVARWLRDRGVPVIDADQVAREIVEPGSPVLQQIVQTFGEEVLDDQGALDRAAMRQRIARDPEARRTLEALTHPAIAARIAEKLAALAQAGEEVAVVEAALMVETGSYRMYPVVLVVSAPPELQLRRLVARDDQDEESARALIAAQLPMEDKERAATHVLRNDGTLADLEARTAEVWAAIQGADR